MIEQESADYMDVKAVGLLPGQSTGLIRRCLARMENWLLRWLIWMSMMRCRLIISKVMID